jgi:hypothetical protein
MMSRNACFTAERDAEIFTSGPNGRSGRTVAILYGHGGFATDRTPPAHPGAGLDWAHNLL